MQFRVLMNTERLLNYYMTRKNFLFSESITLNLCYYHGLGSKERLLIVTLILSKPIVIKANGQEKRKNGFAGMTTCSCS